MSKELDINVAIKSCEQMVVDGASDRDVCDGVACGFCPGGYDFNDGGSCDNNEWGSGIGDNEQQAKCLASAYTFLAKYKPAKYKPANPVAPAKPAPRKHKITVLLDDVELEQRRANLTEMIDTRDMLTKEIKEERAVLAWYARNK